MEEYIRIRLNMVTQFVTTRLLLNLFEETERALGERWGMRWWEKSGIDMKGAREKAVSVMGKRWGRGRRGILLVWENIREYYNVAKLTKW